MDEEGLKAKEIGIEDLKESEDDEILGKDDKHMESDEEV